MLRLDGNGRCGDYAEDNGGGDNDKNKTISDGGITVDFWFIKVHTSN